MKTEAAEPGLTDDERRSLELLERDVARTIGQAYCPLVARYAKIKRELVRGAELVAGVAEEVQEELMDMFVDTTWPACPQQPDHPLWFEDGAWCCDRDRVRVPLGSLVLRRTAL